jgi:hypothetical protein
MVDVKNIQQQLKALKFGGSPWNQAELRELPNIIHEGEKISECVNGFYEGGIALLVATEMRVLLIDKKPLNYLNVEDLRFDMINEIDYSHRLFGATITISTGGKTLKFKSYNQARLRNLINLVQEHMSDNKKDQAEKAETQKQHLEEINRQLQMYLMAQHQQLQQQMSGQRPLAPAELPKPDPQLSDYLFAQRLLEKFHQESKNTTSTPIANTQPTAPPISQAELVADAKREVFGGESSELQRPAVVTNNSDDNLWQKGLEISPLSIAYSKLPMMLRNRKFGRPSLHAHSEQQVMPTGGQAMSPNA